MEQQTCQMHTDARMVVGTQSGVAACLQSMNDGSIGCSEGLVDEDHDFVDWSAAQGRGNLGVLRTRMLQGE